MFNFKELDQAEVEFVAIAPVDQLPLGERMFVDAGQSQIVIINLAGNLYAIGDVCSHDNGPLGEGEIEENEIICPRHGARFDIRTGKTMGLPALVDIPAYPVRVREGMIEVGLPKA
jgi:3-phenylpropionate/trans-cinnamate dioxygenase ferredoxin subunit